jgi:hypothetical protein
LIVTDVEVFKSWERPLRRAGVPVGLGLGVLCLAAAIFSGTGWLGVAQDPNWSNALFDGAAIVSIWGMLSGKQWKRIDFYPELAAFIVGLLGAAANLLTEDWAIAGNVLVAVAVVVLAWRALTGRRDVPAAPAPTAPAP